MEECPKVVEIVLLKQKTDMIENIIHPLIIQKIKDRMIATTVVDLTIDDSNKTVLFVRILSDDNNDIVVYTHLYIMANRE